MVNLLYRYGLTENGDIIAGRLDEAGRLRIDGAVENGLLVIFSTSWSLGRGLTEYGDIYYGVFDYWGRKSIDGVLMDGTKVITIMMEPLDHGLAVEYIYMTMTKEASDVCVGAEYVNIAREVLDDGVGADYVNMIKELVDLGVGVDVAEWLTSIYGMVLIDNENIGLHSIPYEDLVRDGLPIQTQHRAVDDRVYLDEAQIGELLIEWEDKVADLTKGYRVLRVLGTVRIVD